MKRLFLGFTLFVMPTLASAQMYSGPVKVVDGDTLDMTGQRLRLYGVDAPERMQTCKRDGQPWACGTEASTALTQWIAGRTVECEQKDRDTYGRTVAVCSVDRMDLSEELVRTGLAVALPNATNKYVEVEHFAKQRKHGIWAGEFDIPSAYRLANPSQFSAPKKQAVRSPARISQPSPPRAVSARPANSGVYYYTCQDAWAAGAAPLYRGDAGYRVEMDGDKDGVACEPYRGGRRGLRR